MAANCAVVTSSLDLAFQCSECLRLETIENVAWAEWLAVKGLQPGTIVWLEKRNVALNALYAAHFHRKKCPVASQSEGRN
jgi:hypothetical protein